MRRVHNALVLLAAAGAAHGRVGEELPECELYPGDEMEMVAEREIQLGDDLEVRVGSDQPVEALTHDRVIIHHEDAGRGRHRDRESHGKDM